MRKKFPAVLLLLAAVNFQLLSVSAQGTAFTYQGRLNNASGPANGTYNVMFTLFNTNTFGVPVVGPVTNTTTVSNGLFMATVDFGAGAFTGTSNWLELAVRTNGGTIFSTLTPRQPITPTPYAIYAANAGNAVTATTATTAGSATIVTGLVSSGQLSGTIGSTQIAPSAVGNFQLGLCKITGFVTCNATDPTHTFVYVRGTSSLAYVGDSTVNGYPYQLTLLEPGTYTVVSRTSGGYEVASPVTVTAGQTVANINFSGANLMTDVNNCGACSNACNLANAIPGCSAGNCVVAGCNAGYANCDGNAANGCEVNVSNNINNCGGCGVVCSTPNGTPACTGGACQIAGCNAGYADCDSNAANGCEVNVSNNINNCGGCGVVCSTPNATPACSGGTCQIAGCNTGYANCDGIAANGCEVNVSNNINNCGGCGVVCSTPNATPACSGGTCQIASCNPGYANCDLVTVNGCETHIASDAFNCGACGHVCATGHACSNGACL